MEKRDVVSKLKQIIVRTLDVDVKVENINDDSLLYDELGIDSVDSLDLIVNVEEEFKLDLSEEGNDFLYSIDTFAEKILSVLKPEL
ncbi:acyl carrier protein [Paenibacillus sp. FSL L8-0436]|uniref:acyl carrier protein n=1 Tax=Paenibacillus sp. FSL L8-0436 TaxID=2954686 RepID=UPI00315931ED